MRYPVTPDGRYFVVRGRLWRMTNPNLDPSERARLTKQLLRARRAVRDAHLANDGYAAQAARAEVDRIKRALGERGPPWWDDEAPDYSRQMARNTPYASWWSALRAQPDRQKKEGHGLRGLPVGTE